MELLRKECVAGATVAKFGAQRAYKSIHELGRGAQTPIM